MGDGFEGVEEIFVGEIAVARHKSHVCYRGVEISGVLTVLIVFELPEAQPGGDVGLELRNEGVEGCSRGVCSDDFKDGKEDMVARGRRRRQDIEDCGQCCDC